jgi:micrococcal nuclease
MSYYDLSTGPLDQENTMLSVKKNSNYEVFSLDNLELSGKVTDVHDGDSVTILMKVPFIENPYLWKCRLNGIDTPEITSKNKSEKEKAIMARDFIKELILDKDVQVKCHKFDKYGRLLVNVTVDDKDLSELLISKNYAHFYDGRKKEKWT